MSKIGWVTTGVLAAMVVVILLMLFSEAASGPSFRAEDHASFQECIRAIPAEWGPGSLDRTGAEEACHYVHQRRRPR